MIRNVAALVLAVAACAALAQGAPTPTPDDPAPFIGAFLTAFQARNFALMGVLGTIALVWALRKVGTSLPGKIGPFLASRRGGAILALVGGLASAIAIPLLAGKGLGGSVLVDALAYGLASAGGWTIVRRIVLGEDVAQK